MNKSTPSLKAYDLFCGVGGLTYGLKQAGIDVCAGMDIDETCADTYERNNQSTFVHSDIKEMSYKDIEPHLSDSDYKILVGCAPCQPFSAHSFKNKNRTEDEKWGLIGEFLRIIKEGMPDVISMENVPRLKKEEIYKHFKKNLMKYGYTISDDIIACSDYGVPQNRKRLVLLASLHGKLEMLPSTQNKPVSVKDAISKQRKLQSGEQDKKDPLHRSRNLSELNIKRIQYSEPGGSWKKWPKNLLPDCYKKASGQSYSSVYGRMSWDKPAPTITTQFHCYGSGRFGHPDQDRALSLREGALLQSFPPDYVFYSENENPPLTRIGRHIGNAVPPLLAKAIGMSIKAHLGEHYARG